MDAEKTRETAGADLRDLVREVMQEMARAEQGRTEPAHKLELVEEKRRREQLERRVNELVEENRRSRALAEESERNAAIRSELQRLGVGKVELAFRAVKDDIARTEDGRLVARTDGSETNMREFLAHFVAQNPELLPARMTGGSGATPQGRASATAPIEIERIKPGMSEEDLNRVRQEISRVAGQVMRGA